MSNRKIIVEFLGKDTSLGRSTVDVDRKTSKLGDTLKKVGKVAGVALAAGAVLAGKALFDMTKQAIDDEAAQAKLADQMRRSAGATDAQIKSTEDWIAAQGKALGVADDQLRPALQKLVAVTGDVGKAQELTSLAMDTAAGTGRNFESVVDSLIRAQNGSVGGLSRLGIATKNAAGETLTFEQATAKMAKTFGGAAQTQANTLQGRMQRLRVAFDEAKESIGARLIPVVTTMVEWFMNKAMPAIQAFGATMSKKLGPILKKVISWFKEDLLPALKQAWKDILPGVKEQFEQVRKGLKAAQPFFSFLGKVLTKVLLPVFGKLISLVLPAVGRQIRLVGQIIGLVAKGFGKLKDGAVTAAKWIRDKFNGIVNFFRDMPAKVRKATSGMWDGIKDAFRASVNWLISRWNNLAFSIPSIDTHIPGVGTIGGFTLGTPDIPLMDRGGVVQGPGLVRVGPIKEAMVPLSGPGARGGVGGVTVVINGPIFGDGRAVAREIRTMLLREKRLIGGDLGLA